MAFIRVAALSEIADGGVLGVEAQGNSVCLARIEDAVYAFSDNCSHRDFPLSNGELDVGDCSITCEWHGARFDIRSGQPLCLPATRPITVYPCRIEDDSVLIDID